MVTLNKSIILDSMKPENIDKLGISHTHRVVVGAYIFDSRGRMLLLLRNNPPYVFAPPGGRLNPDENPRNGIFREVVEEAGIEIELFAQPFIWFGSIVKDSPPVISLDFIAHALDSDVKLSDEHSDFIWATRDQIEKNVIITIDKDGFGYDTKHILDAFDVYLKLKDD